MDTFHPEPQMSMSLWHKSESQGITNMLPGKYEWSASDANIDASTALK